MPGQNRLTSIQAKIVADPQLALEDVWVDKHSDVRYMVESLQPTAVLAGLTLMADAVLHQIPFSHPIYQLPLTAASPLVGEEILPQTGTGSVTVDHHTGGTN
jgi:hypothetical protein